MKTKVNSLSRTLLTLGALFTIVVPSAMDLNSTHMTNPLWPAHARFHWAVGYLSIIQINLLALYLLWGNHAWRGSRLSVLLTAVSPVLFWGNFFPALLLPGTSSWPDGVTPFASLAPNVIMAGVITMVCFFCSGL